MGQAKTAIVSVITSVILMSALTYFMIPYLVPEIEEIEDTEETEEIPKGLILQSFTNETNTIDGISDDEMEWTIIDGMEWNITTQGGSILELDFYSPMSLAIHPYCEAMDGVRFNVTFEIMGVRNQSIELFHYRTIDNSSYSFYEMIYYPVNMRILTPVLDAGAYSARVMWRSEWDALGDNQLTTSPFFTSNPSYLVVKEISA